MSAPHNNHGLFSDHYLKHHLPELSGEELEQARADQDALRAIYAKGIPLAEGADEQVCEYQLLRPTLARLGFAMDPQPPLRTVESTFKPDYALFADDAALSEAVAVGRGEDAYFDGALAVGEAKSWNRDLGSADQDNAEAARRQHPGAQIRRYLLDSTVRWGILTNGRLWRIYERERSRAGFRYYEVDLPALLEADVQDFRYFWRFFRREAFARDAEGRSKIGAHLEGSIRYWLGLTDRLRGRVYDALGTLMTGMIEGSPDLSDDDLPAVHEASLIVLYRLLFCFYAEARNLLPTDNPVYRENHSAQTKLSEIAQRHDTRGGAWSRSGRSLWQWFRDLSRIINDGDPQETGVPEYDGGLFDPAEWPLLGNPVVAVPDFHLAEVIDRIGRDWDRESDSRAFLDYSELTVRELGSIYEGLLEMRPQRDGGEIVLLTDRGERKATGSYYTPEYIVDYIVTNTLDPLLTEAAAEVKERLPGIQAQIDLRERAIADREPGHPDSAQNLRKIDELKLELLEPYFELMVLDPAMGSGHFLVAASEEITEAIITDPSHMPPAEAADEDDENIYYKRRVVERCLYGVDLNPLAVELAKLSLWLHTVEFGKPLSFLKHHLRHGNSLIGARLEEMRVLPTRKGNTKKDDAQLNLFTSRFMREATDLLAAFSIIEKMPTDTHQQKEEKQAAWDDIERRRAHFRQIANVWLSLLFGNDLPQATYEALVNALDRPDRFHEIAGAKWFARAQMIADEHTFFHWELEFPEAFFTRTGLKRESERGFDAVVGNPPYGATLPGPTGAWLERAFPMVSSNRDTYAAMMELSVRWLGAGGRAGMIVPDAWTTGVSYAPMRERFLSLCTPRIFVDLPYDVFAAAYIDCLVYVAEPKPATGDDMCEVIVFSARDDASDRMGSVDPERIEIRSWLEDDQISIRLKWTALDHLLSDRVETLSEPLSRHLDIQSGITPYGAAGHKPASRADRIHHSSVRHSDEWLPDFTGSCRRYTLTHGEDQFVHYCEGLVSAPERRFFSGPRLLIRRMISRQFRIQASFVAEELAIDDSSYFALSRQGEQDLWFCLAIFNSRVLSWYEVGRSAIALRDDYPKLTLTETRALPIRIIDFDHPTGEALKEEALGRCREAVEAGDYETPFVLARAALAAHAAAHGPAGKPELREDEYWREEIAWLADDKLRADGGVRTTERRDLREDVVHDLLAWLAQRMIDLNRQKHERKQQFLNWLERQLGCALDDLSGRTIIRDFDDREQVPDYAELSRRLCAAANRRKMSVDPRRAQYDTLVCEAYTEAMETLDALNASLAQTDALIDRIVYALYGLGPEEIAIIEGGEA